MPIFDAHIDYAMPWLDARNVDAENAPQVPDALVRGLRGALLSIWTRWQETADPWNVVEAGIKQNNTLGEIALTLGDASRMPAFFHHLEGADMLGTVSGTYEMYERLDRLYAFGVRSITPIYSHGNAFGGGSNQPDGPGLTELGVALLDRMDALGMLIDTAHMNLHTRADVLAWAATKASRPRVSYTHGALTATVRFADGRAQERGISLEQAEEIRTYDGIVGLAVSRPFFSRLSEFDDTLDLFLSSPLGTKGVALGTDFGGVAQEELFPGMTNHADAEVHLRGRVERGELTEEAYEDVTHRNMEVLLASVIR